MKRVLAVILLAASGCTFDVDLPETPQRGRVLGKIDTQGHPVPLEGQTITLSGEGGVKLTQLTDTAGAFVFADLAPGLYLVSAKLPGFAKFTSDLLRVIPGQDTDAGTFAPDWQQSSTASARVKGKVGTQEGAGDVNGTKVEFALEGNVIDQMSVAGDGQFIQTLPPGTYTIIASHPSFESVELKDVILPEGAVVDITVTPLLLGPKPATLQGKVMQEVDGADPIPAVGATVTIQETGAHSDVDVAGNFIITGLTGGSYQVRIQKLGGFHDLVPTRPVTLTPLETSTLDDVTLLLDRGNIVGTVSTGSTPVSGARVEVVGTHYVALVSADPADPTQGSFQIANIPIGPWTVTARKDQFSNASASVMVAANNTANAGVLTLARLLGDFLIDDADPANTSGYTRTLGVTLNFAGFPPTGITGYRASEDPNFASFDGGFLPYSGKLQPFTLAAGEGPHTVYAQYDVAGQSSQAFSSTIVLDTIAPETPAVSFDATGTAGSTRYTNRSQNLTLDVLSSDGTGSGISLMRVGDVLMGNDVSHATEPYKLNAVLTRSTVVDGPQNVYVQVIDFAGNVSDAGSDVIIVDTVAPTGSITLANGPKATDPGYTNTTLVTVNQTWSDASDAGMPADGGVVLIKLANTSADLNAALYQPVSPSSGWFLDPIGEVSKTVWAKFRDAAGNETVTAASASITYDITPPTPASISIVGATTTNNPLVTVALVTNPADLSTMQAFTLSDESTFTSSSTVGPSALPGMSQSPFTFSAGDGVRTVYARFRDRAGNDSITSTQVTLDTVAPSGSFTLTGTLADGTPSSSLTSSNQVTVNLVPGGATEYRLGDASMTSCPASGYTAITSSTLTNQTLPAGGVMTLCLRDAARNPQGPLSQAMTLDNTAPTGCAFSVAGKRLDGSAAPAGLTALTSLTAAIGTCVETPTEYFVSTAAVVCANSLAWQPYAASTTVSFASGDGLKTVFGCVRDAARNVTSITSANITLDTAGPTPVSATLVGAALTNAASATMNISATDPSGLGTADAVTASEDPFFNAAGTVGPLAFPGSNQVAVNLSAGDGAKTIYVRFRDRLQNATVANVTVTRDTTAPTGSFTLSGALADGTPSSTLTSSNLVTVTMVPTGASEYRLGDATMLTCPAAGYTAITSNVLSSQTLPAGGIVTLCLRDGAGNAQGPLSQSMALDGAAPAGCAFSIAGKKLDGSAAPAGLTALTALTVSIGSCGEVPSEYFISTSPVTCAHNLAWQPFAASSAVNFASGDGAKSVFGCVRDAARNFNGITTGSITLDTAGPTPPTATLVGSALTNAATATLNLAATDPSGLGTTDAITASEDPFFNASGTVGPTAFPGTNQVTVNLSAGDGEKTIYVRFRDRLQNATFANVAVTRDVSAPSGSLVIEGNLADGTPSQTTAAPYLTSPPTVKVYLSAGSGASQYAFVPTAATACAMASYNPLLSTTLSTTLVTAGATGNTYLCLKDAAGNVTPTALSDSDGIAYLSAPPAGCVLTLAGLMADGTTAAPAGQTAKPVITATVSGCGATATEFYLATGTVTCSAFVSASYVTYSGPSTAQPFLLPAEGANTVSGCVRDAAHNVFTLAPKAVNLDSTPPAALGLSINSDDTYFNAAQLTGGQIIVSVDGQATGATQWALAEPPTVPSSFVAFTGAPVPFTFSTEGKRGLVALFRDALGNVSAAVSDSIEVDITAPSLVGRSVSISSPTNNNYVNNNTVTVNAVYPADALTSQLVEDLVAPLGTCNNADFASASTTSAAGNYTFVLNATNGLKRVCLRWYDEAGNVTGPVTDTKTLDTVAPPPVTILTSGRTFNPLAGGESLNQLISFIHPPPDPEHNEWQALGGAADAGWYTFDAGAVAFPVPFTAPFSLAVAANVPQGIPNILRIRESDLAGNYSGESSVIMITDIVPPQPVTLNGFWVDNASTSGVVHWQKSASPDITGYLLYYGAAPGMPGGLSDGGSVWADGGNLFADGGYIEPVGYNGFYATQGASPVLVGDQTYAPLDNLPNGALNYITVRAMDHAGNIGLQPTAPVREVLVQPNEVSPNLLMDVPVLRDAGYVGSLSGTQVALWGDYAYVMAGTHINFSCPGTGNTVVQAFDLSTVVSPIQGGAILANAPGIISYPPVLVNDEQCSGTPGAIQVEYPFLFTASGRHFRVWSIANPRVPTPIADLVFGATANLNALDVRGPNVLIAGNNAVYHVDISSLYDNNQATRALTLLGTQVLNPTNPNSNAINWSRNKAMVTNFASGSQNNVLDVSNAVDNNGATNIGVAPPPGVVTSLSNAYIGISQTHGNGFFSGYYSVVGEIDGLHVFDALFHFFNISPYWTQIGVVPFGAWGQSVTIGHQAFLGETSTGGLVNADLSDLTNIRKTGVTRGGPTPGFQPRPSGLAIYGNYAMQVTDAANGSPNMRIYEVATPRGLRPLEALDNYASGRIHITPGFTVSSSGLVVDLWGGGTPKVRMAPTAGNFCAYSSALFDDTLVSAIDFSFAPDNGSLRFTSLDNAWSRPSTPVNVTSAAPSNSIEDIAPLPASSYARGLDRVGNYLVMATTRSTNTLWLEAYRASALRSGLPQSGAATRQITMGGTPGVGDKVSEYNYAATGSAPSFLHTSLRVSSNLAVVSGDNHVWIVDIAPMLDDTTLTAMAATSVQGDVTGVFPRDAVLSGNKLYVIGTPSGGVQSLIIYDASAAFDGIAGTTVTAANFLSATPISAATSVAVHGTYALVAGYNGVVGGITSIDVSVPTSPKIISYLPNPIGTVNPSCGTYTMPGIDFVGSRAYVGYNERFDILDLE